MTKVVALIRESKLLFFNYIYLIDMLYSRLAGAGKY